MLKRKTNKKTNTKVRNATPMVVDEISFRSKLEVFMFQQLKEAGIPVDYEKHIYNLVDKFEYSSPVFESHKIKGSKDFVEVSNKVRAITYTPDFVNTEKKFIIEVKGYANDVFPIKWKMFKAFLNGQGYTLFLPSTQKQVKDTVEIIKKMFYDEKNN